MFILTDPLFMWTNRYISSLLKKQLYFCTFLKCIMLHQATLAVSCDQIWSLHLLVRYMFALYCDISLKVLLPLRSEQLSVGNSHFLATSMTRIQQQISGHWHMILCFLTNCASVLHCAFTVLNKILTSVSLCCVVSSWEILFS